MWADMWASISAWFANIWDKIYLTLIVEERWLLLLDGLWVTIQITFLAILLGTVLGILLALMKISNSRFLRGVAGVYISVIRGTPVVVQLMIIYFVILAGLGVSKVIIGGLAFGINSAAYVAEIIRAGILAVDRGQTEAGRSLGLSAGQTMLRIVLPQAVKNILPAYANEFIVLLKETSVAGYIAVEDLTKAGDIIRSRTYEAFVPLLAVAFIYWTITTLLSRLFSYLERRLRQGD